MYSNLSEFQLANTSVNVRLRIYRPLASTRIVEIVLRRSRIARCCESVKSLMNFARLKTPGHTGTGNSRSTRRDQGCVLVRRNPGSVKREEFVVLVV
jgi:hypothetical protein